jgi:hypothetical protein
MERVKALLNGAGDITPELRSVLMSLASFIHDLAFAAASNQRPVKRLYTVDEAATYLGRTPKALWELIWSGKLPTVRCDRRVYMDIHDLDALIDRSKAHKQS